MIDFAKQKPGAFVPATPEEANGEILGRCNALHDWLMYEAKKTTYFSQDQREACIIMGFTDVLRAADKEDLEPLPFSDMLGDSVPGECDAAEASEVIGAEE